MLIYVDIDGTICEDLPHKGKTEQQYRSQKPFKNRIEKINKLYGQGHTIVYWTARGATKGIDWTDMTTEQLAEWGCKYHELVMNAKPNFDMYICDKSFNSEHWFTQSLYEQIDPVEAN